MNADDLPLVPAVGRGVFPCCKSSAIGAQRECDNKVKCCLCGQGKGADLE
jgi:hypothetical protein